MTHRIDWETLVISLAIVLAGITWIAAIVGLTVLGYLTLGTPGAWIGATIWLAITATAMLYHYWS